MKFPKSNPVFVLPLGVQSPLEFRSSEDLLGYLHRQADGWLELTRFGEAAVYFDDIKEENIKKINSAIQSISSSLEDRSVVPEKSVSRIIQRILSHTIGAWVDPTAANAQGYMELARGGANLKQLKVELVELQMIREAKWLRFIEEKRPFSIEAASQAISDITTSASIDPKGDVSSYAAVAEPREFTRAEKELIASEVAEKLNLMLTKEREEAGKGFAKDVDAIIIDKLSRISSANEKLTNVEGRVEKLRQLVEASENLMLHLQSAQQASEARLVAASASLEQASDGMKGSLEKLRSELDARLNATLAAVELAHAELRKGIDDAATTVEDSKKKTAEELDAFKARYEEKSRLHLPTEYWSRKANKHEQLSILAFLLFVSAIMAAFLQGYIHSGSIWARLQEIQNQNSGIINLTGLAVVTIPAVAFFWILKHISRIFVDNLAQANDAGQRRVMMQTYLALVGDPTARVTEQERLLVLNALFRPSAGSGSDDAPPSNLLEILTKLGDGKKDGK